MQWMIDGVVFGLLLVLVLILGNGFFVAGEFALVASDRSKLERLAEEGHRGARSTLRALKNLSFQLSGAQLGITITSLVLGFVVEPTLGRLLEPVIDAVGFIPERSVFAVAVGLGLAIATATQMVISELVPQNIAISRPVATAFIVATPLRFFNALFRPLILMLNASANATVRLLGIEPRDELRAVHSLEELELLIRSSREEGALTEEDFSLLARSLSFGTKVAADVLVPRTSIEGLERRATIPDLVALSLETGHSRFPVHYGDLDHIVGVVYVKDSWALEPEARPGTPVEAIMQNPLVVPESLRLDKLLGHMRAERKQLVVVIDEYGGTAGIITLEDLLEEIVGEIEDEYDPGQESSAVSSPRPGIAVVPGLIHPDELEEATRFEMPEGDYETLGGFLLSLFDRIPSPGDHATYEGWELKVVRMDGNRIDEVLVVTPPPTVPPLPHTSEDEAGE